MMEITAIMEAITIALPLTAKNTGCGSAVSYMHYFSYNQKRSR